MPGPITHLKAAYYYNINHGYSFGGELYLGSISPDSVNINGHAPRLKRWPAHLRCADLDAWTDNANSFYKENKGKTDEGYLRGYIIHILTDIVWDKEFDMPLFALMHRNGIERSQLKDERWNEIYGYEQEQLSEEWLSHEVLPQLAVAEPKCIGTLDVGEVKSWRDTVASLQLSKGTKPKLVDEALMQILFKQVNTLADKIFV